MSENIDDLFREGLANHEAPASGADWGAMHAMLDAAMPVAGATAATGTAAATAAKSMTPLVKGILAVSVTAVTGTTTYVAVEAFSDDPEQQSNTVVVDAPDSLLVDAKELEELVVPEQDVADAAELTENQTPSPAEQLAGEESTAAVQASAEASTEAPLAQASLGDTPASRQAISEESRATKTAVEEQPVKSQEESSEQKEGDIASVANSEAEASETAAEQTSAAPETPKEKAAEVPTTNAETAENTAPTGEESASTKGAEGNPEGTTEGPETTPESSRSEGPIGTPSLDDPAAANPTEIAAVQPYFEPMELFNSFDREMVDQLSARNQDSAKIKNLVRLNKFRITGMVGLHSGRAFNNQGRSQSLHGTFGLGAKYHLNNRVTFLSNLQLLRKNNNALVHGTSSINVFLFETIQTQQMEIQTTDYATLNLYWTYRVKDWVSAGFGAYGAGLIGTQGVRTDLVTSPVWTTSNELGSRRGYQGGLKRFHGGILGALEFHPHPLFDIGVTGNFGLTPVFDESFYQSNKNKLMEGQVFVRFDIR